MPAARHFHDLPIRRVTPEAARAVALTFTVPPELREVFAFEPGQFLTLRADIDGQQQRRSYSICSSRARYADAGELDIAIKPVEGGVFSNWAATNLRAGDQISVMPPDGRFTPRLPGAMHRVGFAAGSGITPLLSIIASTLAADPDSRFTLVYSNQRVGTIMFHEALQDLKDKYPARLTLIHLLSRQPQEVALFNGRLDAAKVGELLATVLPADSIDEAFICGPEGMIDATQAALQAAGIEPARIHAERFFSAGATTLQRPAPQTAPAAATSTAPTPGQDFELDVVMDGKTHRFGMQDTDTVLDIALEGGLDLPYSCKGGVCCTCRAKVLEGRVEMARNFTLEPWEIDKGFVLTCQARPLTPRVVVSYDER
ncbi:1,2-phenylacetyl-CoA epoxidase subunit PaaE [Variovorax sp. VNK109]|jgi:ring-1,2-phenylacetyl-CoA epoxidase subunit PaaE|uniref:1,2-phenylacetyl-CoA epoxidase subunit PaaE n=1 Tax=Variovorax sp. VNK109 TaxID=3400919 RepID=UPI003C02E353